MSALLKTVPWFPEAPPTAGELRIRLNSFVKRIEFAKMLIAEARALRAYCLMRERVESHDELVREQADLMAKLTPRAVQ